MNINYTLSKLLDVKDLKITVSPTGGFVFEGNGMTYDGSFQCAEEAFFCAIVYLHAPEIMKNKIINEYLRENTK